MNQFRTVLGSIQITEYESVYDLNYSVAAGGAINATEVLAYIPTELGKEGGYSCQMVFMLREQLISYQVPRIVMSCCPCFCSVACQFAR